jgi:hypothetical protein
MGTAKMHIAVACEETKKKRLQISYHGFIHVVEVHACGFTKDGNAIMRVWQVRGGSLHNEPVGWKLLRLNEAITFSILDESADVPRPGYRHGDRAMARIAAQI